MTDMIAMSRIQPPPTSVCARKRPNRINGPCRLCTKNTAQITTVTLAMIAAIPVRIIFGMTVTAKYVSSPASTCSESIVVITNPSVPTLP